MGRGFSVFETSVIAGGYNIADEQKRLISRNVMQIVIPAKARVVKVLCKPATGVKGGGTSKPAAHDADAHSSQKSTKSADADAKKECERSFIDVHIATPNGISNDLHVDVEPKSDKKEAVDPVEIAATTTVARDGPTTTTSTTFKASPPGVALPPLTVLPLATQWPPETVLAPGSVTPAPKDSILPGMTPVKPEPAASPGLYPTPLTPATPKAATPTVPSTTPVPAAPPAGALLQSPRTTETTDLLALSRTATPTRLSDPAGPDAELGPRPKVTARETGSLASPSSFSFRTPPVNTRESSESLPPLPPATYHAAHLQEAAWGGRDGFTSGRGPRS